MKFKKLKLYTNQIEAEWEFYTETLGFHPLEHGDRSFSIKVGWSQLMFEKSEKAYQYHYCFLISANHLSQALEWMERRTTVLFIEGGRKIQHFAAWNADSFYFYDASGNVAECIVRHDLMNQDERVFDSSKILGINEMGMPTDDIRTLNEQLEKELKTTFWKGDMTRFGTNGSQEGIWVLPNYKQKEKWFPTSVKIKPDPFEAIVENKGKCYKVEYTKECLSTITISS